MDNHNGLSPPDYFGLRNQGATCYLNSVLQVLFMTQEFREAVRKTAANCGSEFIDQQLKSLFDALTKQTGHTTRITKKLGITRVHEQCDAAECFDKILNKTSPEASQIFGGQLTQRNICYGCRTQTDTDGPFWSLPLTLVDHGGYSVTDGIDQYFTPVYMIGDNQMYCETCDNKADATAIRVIKHHPDVLTLLLKRFKFDYRYMECVKIQCNVQVPCTLQIPENQTYELYAFVEHFGSLSGGHYTSAIKSQDDDNWYDFNDTMVSMLDYQPFQEDSTEISKSAYLLFYRKKKMTAADETNGVISTGDKEFRDNKGLIPDRKTGSDKQGKKRRRNSSEEHPDNQHVAKSIQKRQADDKEISDKSKRLEYTKNDNDKDKKMVTDDQVEKESRTEVHEKKNESESARIDLNHKGCKDSRKVGNSKHGMIKNDLESKEVIRKTSHAEDTEQSLEAGRQNLTQEQKSRKGHDHEFQSVNGKEDEKMVNNKVNKREGSFQDNRKNGSFRQQIKQDQESTKKQRDNVHPRQEAAGTRERADEDSHRRGTSERTCSKAGQGWNNRPQQELELEICEERQIRRGAGEMMKPLDQKHRYSERKGQTPPRDNPVSTEAELTTATGDKANAKGGHGPNNLDTLSEAQCHSSTLNDSPPPKASNNCTKESTGEIERENDTESNGEQMAKVPDTQCEKNKQKKRKSKRFKWKCLFCGLCCKKKKH